MIKRIFSLFITTKMVLHLNEPEIQFIGLLEFVFDEYLCCSIYFKILNMYSFTSIFCDKVCNIFICTELSLLPLMMAFEAETPLVY
jgi:hypothetical protein